MRHVVTLEEMKAFAVPGGACERPLVMPTSSAVEVAYHNAPELLQSQPFGLYREMVTSTRNNALAFAWELGGAIADAASPEFGKQVLKAALAL